VLEKKDIFSKTWLDGREGMVCLLCFPVWKVTGLGKSSFSVHAVKGWWFGHRKIFENIS